MPTEIKICGLSDEEGVDAALAAGADFVGFAFFAGARATSRSARAAALAGRARGQRRIVAFTVDAATTRSPGDRRAAAAGFPAAARPETPERVAAIRAPTGRPVMKAIGVAEPADLARGHGIFGSRRSFAPRCQAAARRHAAGRQRRCASIGRSCAALRRRNPGSCRAASMPPMSRTAIAVSGAPGVDVSSGVESAPGRKDPARIRAFVARRQRCRGRAARAG